MSQNEPACQAGTCNCRIPYPQYVFRQNNSDGRAFLTKRFRIRKLRAAR